MRPREANREVLAALALILLGWSHTIWAHTTEDQEKPGWYGWPNRQEMEGTWTDEEVAEGTQRKRDPGEETEELVVVQVEGGMESAKRLAERHGLQVERAVEGLQDEGYFVLRSSSASRAKREDLEEQGPEEQLDHVEQVKWWAPLTRRPRAKRTVDPMWEDQWHLHDHNVSLNVEALWQLGLEGQGMRLSILDDGINPEHPDIADNFWEKGSYDVSFNKSDPTPEDPDDKHGTRAAGTAAAIANNSICGTGVAPKAKIAGVKVLGRDPNDAEEAWAVGFMCDDPHEPTHVYSASWGPSDDGKRIEGPGRLMKARLKHCITKGRFGRGSLYVWAGGNGGLFGDNMNYDGYVNSRYTISIGAINEAGGPAYYSEPGACMLAVAPSSGRRGRMISTMDIIGCTDKFGGTSAACPMVAGLVALMAQANQRLSWRDMQHVIVRTARRINPTHHNWQRNGAGFWFNHFYGFGLIVRSARKEEDGEAAVKLAKRWIGLPQSQVELASEMQEVEDAIEEGRVGKYSLTWKEEDVQMMVEVEHVEIWVEAKIYEGVGSSTISLFSPAGTQSDLLVEGLNRHTELRWTFTSVAHWGERPTGTWTLKLSPKHGAILHRWQLHLYGFNSSSLPLTSDQ